MRILCTVLIALGAVIIFYCLLLIISSYLINPEKEYNKNSKYYRFLLNSATACSLKLIRIKVKINGIENLPTDGRFLLVCNHISKFDPIISWYILRKYDIAFISKPENFKVPFFGRIIQKCCFMPIDRENPRNAVKTINRAVSLIEKYEVSVGVYPEGTRSKDGVLLPFHNSVFKIAQKANVPIIVMTIIGTEKIHKNYPLHRSVVEMDFVNVLPACKIKSLRTAEIGDTVRKTMIENGLEG